MPPHDEGPFFPAIFPSPFPSTAYFSTRNLKHQSPDLRRCFNASGHNWEPSEIYRAPETSGGYHKMTISAKSNALSKSSILFSLGFF